MTTPHRINGWLEAAIAWNVCASIHERFAKRKDALYTTRHKDFVARAKAARKKARAERAVAERDALRADAERYRWLRSWRWRCVVAGMYGVNLDAAIDAAILGARETPRAAAVLQKPLD